MSRFPHTKIVVTTPRGEQVEIVVREEIPMHLWGLYWEFSTEDGQNLYVRGETKLAELVLHTFDYAMPEPWAKDYRKECGEWPRGVWCYDKELGFSSVFGGFLSREKIVELAEQKIVAAYLEAKHATQDA